eukprot:2516503-Karenia_brevis.AAC.1
MSLCWLQAAYCHRFGMGRFYHRQNFVSVLHGQWGPNLPKHWIEATPSQDRSSFSQPRKGRSWAIDYGHQSA